MALMRRAAVQTWWKRSDARKGAERFGDWAEADPWARDLAKWPTWLMLRSDEGPMQMPRIFQRLRLTRLLGGFWRNLRHGILGIFNIAVLTVLPAVLWEVGWQFGWDNSFNKGYEQYYVGIALSWLGILLFLMAMLYLPMAHARQSISGEWRRFYDFKVVLAIILARPGAVAMLAALYSLVSLPLAVLKALPYAFPAMNSEIETMSAVDLLALINRYYFWVSVAGFILYAFLKTVSAKVYARNLVHATQSARLPWDTLADFEKEALGNLGFVVVAATPTRHPAWQLMWYTARPIWVGAIIVATLLLWFSFVAQIYVSEFIKHHPRHGFLNQPLVQLPWFRYVPRHLERAAEAEQAGAGEGEEEDLSPLFRR